MANDINCFQRSWKWGIRRAKRLAGGAIFILTLVGCAIAYQTREDNKGPTNVLYIFRPIKTSKGIVIDALLKNNDSINADRLRLKGKYEGTIFNVITKTEFDKIISNKWDYQSIDIELDKLTVNNACNIYIIADCKFRLTDKINIAWGNGRYVSADITAPTKEEEQLISNVDNANIMLNNSINTYLNNNQTTVASKK